MTANNIEMPSRVGGGMQVAAAACEGDAPLSPAMKARKAARMEARADRLKAAGERAWAAGEDVFKAAIRQHQIMDLRWEASVLRYQSAEERAQRRVART